MRTLREQLAGSDKRGAVVDDCCRVLDQEVSDKSGLAGLAVKAAYKVVQGVAPGFVRQVVEHLLDDFLDALQPVYAESLEQGIVPSKHLVTESSRVADALLSVTDRRAEKAKRAVIKKTYEKLRPAAKKHVEAAAPRLGALLENHAEQGSG
ncbi:MAG TPA: hypothetical protein VF989_11005 [Polyangiaceae bacterium]|jgi:hypothetical protein